MVQLENRLCMLRPFSNLLGHSSTTSLFENPPSREDLQDESLSCPELQDRHEAAWPDLLVMDLRSYAAALGNRAKGGGCECTGEQ